MYEIIEKNQYGVLVDQLSNPSVLACTPCKYSKTKSLNEEPCLSCNCDGYYLSDSEAEKLESENPLMNTTIDDLYIESKCYFEVKKKLDDTQKELIDLQIENKQLKEMVAELKSYIEKLIWDAKCKLNEYGSISSTQYYKGEIAAYTHCLSQLENQK